jgi:hypothetical protein
MIGWYLLTQAFIARNFGWCCDQAATGACSCSMCAQYRRRLEQFDRAIQRRALFGT